MAIWSRLAGRFEITDPRRPLGPDHLFPEETARGVPRIARFVAADGSARIGLVLESSQGVPRRLLDLTARHGVGPGFIDFVAANGLALAEQELARCAATGDGADQVTLEPAELSERLLSPVDIDAGQIERGDRLVVGFGLTFRSHRAETGSARPFIFPKPTAPGGAYAPVSATGGTGGSVGLLDYELELGCVALRDIDLDRLQDVRAADDFGYLVVNDVTEREPILRSRQAGYTRAKGRPTYLPCGPWIVPGPHFTRDAPALRRMVLTVSEAAPFSTHHPHTLRQDARLEELTLGLRELLALLSRHRSLTMRGRDGRRWPVSVDRGGRRLLPAGSLLMTGTPGGTAIRAPGLVDKLSLVLRSVRHLRWPSEDYRRHLEHHRHAFGFLSPGDRVSGWITGLGRQEWQVEA